MGGNAAFLNLLQMLAPRVDLAKKAQHVFVKSNLRASDQIRCIWFNVLPRCDSNKHLLLRNHVIPHQFLQEIHLQPGDERCQQPPGPLDVTHV